VRAETRHSLKEDRFRVTTIEAAEKTAHWTAEHRSSLMVAAIVVAVLLAAGVGIWQYINHQDQLASVDFGKAVQIMQAPIVPAGTPSQPGQPTFTSVQDRATAAQKQLKAIVDKYPRTRQADFSRYFLGVTAAELGDNATAQNYLSEVASIRNKDVAGLAKLALASVYRNTNKDAQAIDLYKQLIDKPTMTVSKVTAQMELASLYQAKQNSAEAKKIYEQVQKDNPAGEAAQMATQKLGEMK
jgi:tetratricopeptide (TPR) repeat protein